MRTVIAAVLFASMCGGQAWAEEKRDPVIDEQMEGGVHFDACFGDRYESDKELNEGNEISDQELQRLIDAMNSPSV